MKIPQAIACFQAMDDKTCYNPWAMSILTVTCESLNELSDYRNAGADEAILALKDGAFSSMHEFTCDEILDACKKAHELGLRLAVLMNRLFGQLEKEKASETLRTLLASDVDAIFFADPAMYMLAKKYGVVEKMIYDPETLMTSINDANWWLSRKIEGIASHHC